MSEISDLKSKKRRVGTSVLKRSVIDVCGAGFAVGLNSHS